MLSWGGIEYDWGFAGQVLVTFAIGAVFLIAALIVQERRAPDPLLPPRVFAGLGVSPRRGRLRFSLSIALFGGTFLLPLYFQLTHGVDASTSGLLVMPFLAANVAGAYAGGNLARRYGTDEVHPGQPATVWHALLGFVGPDSLVGRHTPLIGLAGRRCSCWACGIGSVMPTSMVTVQNAAERRDVGTATGSLLFLRSMGGAFGSTLVGALLTMRFESVMKGLGVTRSIDLGSLRSGSEAFAGLDAATQDAAQAALVSAFRLNFMVCGFIALVALVVALGVRDLPLRTTAGSSHEGAIGH